MKGIRINGGRSLWCQTYLIMIYFQSGIKEENIQKMTTFPLSQTIKKTLSNNLNLKKQTMIMMKENILTGVRAEAIDHQRGNRNQEATLKAEI